MKTVFGKELTKIRLDNNITLKDMAAGLGVPPSYLSAVESASEKSGKKLTSDFLEKILEFLKLDADDEIKLRSKAYVSGGEFSMDTASLELKHVDTLTMFAKRIADLGDKDLEKIRDILNVKG